MLSVCLSRWFRPTDAWWHCCWGRVDVLCVCVSRVGCMYDWVRLRSVSAWGHAWLDDEFTFPSVFAARPPRSLNRQKLPRSVSTLWICADNAQTSFCDDDACMHVLSMYVHMCVRACMWMLCECLCIHDAYAICIHLHVCMCMYVHHVCVFAYTYVMYLHIHVYAWMYYLCVCEYQYACMHACTM